MKSSVFVIILSTLFALTSTAASRDTIIQGVNIKFTYTQTIYPESWRLVPISGQGESLAKEEIHRSRLIIARSLKKYPVSVLSTNLSGIYVLKSLKFYDVGYGGTNSTDDVYITNNGIAMGYTDAYVEQTFHHEFSSILFRNYPDFLNQD